MTDEFIPPTTFPARYRTRNGDVAIIEALSSNGLLIGYVDDTLTQWWKHGYFLLGEENWRDLIGAPLPDEEEPEEVILWGNGYECGDDVIIITNFYSTREAAEAARSAGEIRRGIYRIKAERFPTKGGDT